MSTYPAAPPSVLHRGDGLVRDIETRAAQARANDALTITCRDPPFLEPRRERQHVLFAECGFEVRERAEREAKLIGLAVENGVDLAAVAIGQCDPPRSQL